MTEKLIDEVKEQLPENGRVTRVVLFVTTNANESRNVAIALSGSIGKVEEPSRTDPFLPDDNSFIVKVDFDSVELSLYGQFVRDLALLVGNHQKVERIYLNNTRKAA